MGRATIKHNLTNDDLIEKINNENKTLIKDFLMYLKSLQRSPQTINQYEHDLYIFFVWNYQNNNDKEFVNLTKRNIIAFQNYLINDNKNSPARVRRIKSTLSSMSNYIENILDDEYPNFKNIIKKVENPVNQAVREKTILNDKQIQELLDYFVKKKQYKKACAIALGAYSGSRKSEICIFKTDYFKDENIIYGSLYRTPEKIKTKGRGLGKFIHRYVLSKPFKPYLDLWLEQREELGIDSEWLFPKNNDNSQPMNPYDFNSWCETCSKVLGVPFYIHSLRHYFTTLLYRLGLPENVIVDIIGWDSKEMFSVYCDVTIDEEFAKYFDESGIKQIKSTSLEGLNE